MQQATTKLNLSLTDDYVWFPAGGEVLGRVGFGMSPASPNTAPNGPRRTRCTRAAAAKNLTPFCTTPRSFLKMSKGPGSGERSLASSTSMRPLRPPPLPPPLPPLPPTAGLRLLALALLLLLLLLLLKPLPQPPRNSLAKKIHSRVRRG